MDESDQIKHFLITRFNLKHSQWTKQNVLNSDWLYERIEIFEKICYPSVINQTQKNFVWILFFDIQTPLEIKHYIENKYRDKRLRIHYIDGFKELQSASKSIIKSLLNPSDYFITSRLDNDDALHKDYIQTIQSLAILKTKTIIDLVKGNQLVLHNNQGIASLLVYKYNPFISLISNAEKMELVIEKEHTHWNNKAYTYIKYQKKALWLQYIHSNNQLNTFDHSLKKVTINLNDFHITNLEIKPQSFKNKLFNIINLPLRLKNFIIMKIRNLKQRYL
ncbi:MAG TPA: glycosyltransferase [Flavobacterium sp.]|nr:glycosyltransferase [Flavobacterium sp.]